MDKWLMMEPHSATHISTHKRAVIAPTAKATATSGGVSGLASRMGASLSEAHAALALALSRATGIGSAGAPPPEAAGRGGKAATSPPSMSLLSSVIRAAGVAATVTPYARLPNGAALIHGIVSAVLSKLTVVPGAVGSASPDGTGTAAPLQQQVRIAVLHFCSSVFSNDAACTALPPPALATSCEGANPASRIVSALIVLCGGPLSSVLRAELLAVLAKATRHSAHIVAAAWPALCPVILQVRLEFQLTGLVVLGFLLFCVSYVLVM
jgi:hypothetical protein